MFSVLYYNDIQTWEHDLSSLSAFSHACVALKITEKLVAECDSQRFQLIADSYLSMLHAMLESTHTQMQIMATDSVGGGLVCRVAIHTGISHHYSNRDVITTMYHVPDQIYH